MAAQRFTVDSKQTLIALLVSMPNDVKIVTPNVGMSMVSVWGDIKEAVYHQDINTLELIFD